MRKKANILANIVKTLILPVAIYLVMLISTGGRFGRTATMILVLRQSVIPIMIAFGVGFVMSMGMWDLSAGAVVYAAALIGTSLSNSLGLGIPGMMLFCMLIAIALTLLTGVLYRFMNVPSMVVSVGMVMIYEALPRVFGINMVKIPTSDTILSQLPWCLIILGITLVVFYVLYNFTAFGHNVAAIGSNQKIARIAGINVEKTKLLSFVWSGFFLGVTAFMYMSSMTVLRPATAFGSTGIIFDAMMGVFIAFFLGRYCNFAFGIVVGAFSMQILVSGLVSLGMDTTTRNISQGLFMLVLLIFSSNQGVIDAIRGRKEIVKKADAALAESRG